jgi:hypothetical protein
MHPMRVTAILTLMIIAMFAAGATNATTARSETLLPIASGAH